jgi:hypothetical protein
MFVAAPIVLIASAEDTDRGCASARSAKEIYYADSLLKGCRQRIGARLVCVLLILPLVACQGPSERGRSGPARLQGKVLDVLDRPLPGAEVGVTVERWWGTKAVTNTWTGPDGSWKLELQKAPRNGVVHATKQGYRWNARALESLLAPGTTEWVAKLGRWGEPEDFHKLAALSGPALEQASLDVLARSYRRPKEIMETVFQLQDRLRPGFRAAAKDPRAARNCAWLLSLIADEQDLLVLLNARVLWSPEARTGDLPLWWCYADLAGALLNPPNEEGWVFLRERLLEPGSSWAFGVACDALVLSERDRATAVLQEARARLRESGSTSPAARLDEALARRAALGPTPESSNVLEVLQWAVRALDVGDPERRYSVLGKSFSRDGDRALVAIRFGWANCTPFYDFVFKRVNGHWRVQGVWLVGMS